MHETSNYHIKCVLNFQHISAVISGEESPVYDQINKAAKKQKYDNRKVISPVIESVILCGHQGLALRDHQDWGPLKLTEPNENDGNFRALLRFYIIATQVLGDNTLLLVRENSKKNAQYISWKIQNQIVNACFKIITLKVAQKINDCKYFSIIADETADISGI